MAHEFKNTLNGKTYGYTSLKRTQNAKARLEKEFGLIYTEIRNTIGDINEEIDVTIPTTYRHEFEEMIIDPPVQKNSKEKLYKMLGI